MPRWCWSICKSHYRNPVHYDSCPWYYLVRPDRCSLPAFGARTFLLLLRGFRKFYRFWIHAICCIVNPPFVWPYMIMPSFGIRICFIPYFKSAITINSIKFQRSTVKNSRFSFKLALPYISVTLFLPIFAKILTSTNASPSAPFFTD